MLLKSKNAKVPCAAAAIVLFLNTLWGIVRIRRRPRGVVLFAATAVCVFGGIGKANSMELNTALKLAHAWAQDSKDMTLIGQMTVDPAGGFLTKSAGAFFRYDAKEKTLRVSGLVGYNIKIHTKFPDTWDEMVRASKREWTTLGDGDLELYPKKLLTFDPDVILLTKKFTDDHIKPDQFSVEVTSLLSAAHYWFMKRYNEVATTPEATLIKEAPGINERMLRLRPRPWQYFALPWIAVKRP